MFFEIYNSLFGNDSRYDSVQKWPMRNAEDDAATH